MFSGALYFILPALLTATVFGIPALTRHAFRPKARITHKVTFNNGLVYPELSIKE